MSSDRRWPSEALADDVLADVAGVRAFVARLAHELHGDDLKPVQQDLVAVVGQLDELAASLRARLGVPSVLREPVQELPEVRPERGHVTADVVRRMRKNSGAKHRAKP